MIATFVRGAVVTLEVSFTDKTGYPVSPAAVKCRIAYRATSDGTITAEELLMSAGGSGVYSGTWDSSEAVPSSSLVSWHVETNDPSVERIALDGQFALTANPANF